MTIELIKDQEHNITKSHPTLKSVDVEIGWEIEAVDNEFGGNREEEDPYELDGSVFLLNSFRRIRSEDDFVFYNHKENEDVSVSLRDRPEGVDKKEILNLRLSDIAYDISHLVFSLSIHNAIDRLQNFSRVKNVYIAVKEIDSQSEIIRYAVDLSDYSDFNAATVAEFYRIGPEWVFKAGGQGYEKALGDVARDFDVNIRGE